MQNISLNLSGCNPVSCCISATSFDPLTNIISIEETTSEGDVNTWTIDISEIAGGAACCVTGASINAAGELVITREVDGVSEDLPGVPLPMAAISTITNTAAAGNVIASHSPDGAAVPVDIFETVTVLRIAPNGTDLEYIDEAGNTITLAGVISPAGENSISTFVQTVTAVGGNQIGTHSPDGVIAGTPMFETVTSIAIAPNGTDIIYTDEGGNAITLANVIGGDTSVFTQSVLAGNQIGTHSPDGVVAATPIFETVTTLLLNAAAGGLTYTGENGTPVNVALVSGDANNAATHGSDGGVFVPAAAAGDSSQLVQTVQSGNQIATHASSAGGATTAIFETLTALAIAPNGTDLIYTPENGVPVTIPGAISAAETDTTLTLAGSTLTYTPENGTPVNITLPTGATSAVTQVETTGNIIATHSPDGVAAPVNILESITTLTIAGSTLTYTGEDGTPVNITLPTGATSVFTQTETTGNEIGTHSPDGVAVATPIFESITALTIAANGEDLEYVDEAGTTNTIVGAISGDHIQFGAGAPVDGTTPSDPPFYVDNTDPLAPVIYYNLQPQDTWHTIGGDAVLPCDWVPSTFPEALVTTGTNTAYVAPLNPCQPNGAALIEGQIYWIRPHIVSNGAFTVDYNGLGAKTVVTPANLTPPVGTAHPNAILGLLYTGPSPALHGNIADSFIAQVSY